MKKSITMFLIFVLILSSLVLSGCLGAPGPSSTAAPSGGDIFKKVVTMQYLVDPLGLIDAPIDPVVGFVKFLLFMLFLVLLQYGAGFLGLPGYLKWTIATVFALIVSVFMPNSVLLAAAAGYTTIFGLIIVGLPIGLLIWLFFAVDNNYIKLIATLVLLFVLYAVKFTVADMTGATAGAAAPLSAWLFGSLSTWGFMDYVVLFTWIMLAVTVFQIASSFGGSSETRPNIVKRFFDKAAQKTTLTERGKELRHKKREETRDLQNLAREQAELKSLQAAKLNVEKYFGTLQTFLHDTQIGSKNHWTQFTTDFTNLETDIGEVVDDMKKWKQTERRQHKEMTRLIDELVKRGISDRKIKALEKQDRMILGMFAGVEQEVGKIKGDFGKIKRKHDPLVTSVDAIYSVGGRDPADPTPIAGSIETSLNHIRGFLTTLLNSLDDAINNEQIALSETIKIADELKGNWVLENPSS